MRILNNKCIKQTLFAISFTLYASFVYSNTAQSPQEYRPSTEQEIVFMTRSLRFFAENPEAVKLMKNLRDGHDADAMNDFFWRISQITGKTIEII